MAEKLNNRYERNIITPGFGEESQCKLREAKVVVIGAGGLGSPVLQYLAAAGVGDIRIVDFDRVSETNLQRQVLYAESDLGKPKAAVAAERLSRANGDVKVSVAIERLTDENSAGIMSGYDVVVDCTDNYEARYVIDRFCRDYGVAMVYGSAQEASGQAGVFNFDGGVSYSDLYPEEFADGDSSIVGVISPMPGIVGSIQAMETIKIITGFGKPLAGRLLTIDGAEMKFSVFSVE